MKILSIDPGVSNGLAVFTETTSPKYVTMVTKEPFVVFDLFKESNIDQCIIEAFQAQDISKYGLHTVRMVGAIQALCYHLDIPIKTQMPQFRKAFVRYAKMIIDKQETGWVIHQADALAHLLAYQHEQGFIKVFPDNKVTYKDVRIL